LQRRNKCAGEGRTVAKCGFPAFRTFSIWLQGCGKLQCLHQCLRPRNRVAAGFAAPRQHAVCPPGSRGGHLWGRDQCLRQRRLLGTGIGAPAGDAAGIPPRLHRCSQCRSICLRAECTVDLGPASVVGH
ncbi:unnamed protein product, partial [Symbiodinium microadriaticum]